MSFCHDVLKPSVDGQLHNYDPLKRNFAAPFLCALPYLSSVSNNRVEICFRDAKQAQIIVMILKRIFIICHAYKGLIIATTDDFGQHSC